MATGTTVEELDAQVDALVLAIVKHNQVIADAEQAAVADPTHVEHWTSILTLHRQIVDEHITEVRLLRAEIALLPRQRPPSAGS